MCLKLILTFVLICWIISVSTLLCLVKNNYITITQLRFDPVEAKKTEALVVSAHGKCNDIWMVGDSRMAQWDKNLILPANGKIKNLGIEGQTTAQVLYRLKSYLEITSPEWIILEFGINDLKLIGFNKNLSKTVEEECFQNIISVLELCRKNNIRLILINIFPAGNIELFRRFIWNKSVDSSIINLNEKLITYCINNDVFYFDAATLLSTEKHKVKKSYQNGFLHINEEAYRVLSKELLNKYGNLLIPEEIN